MKRTNNNKIVFLLIARMLWDKGVGEYVEAAKIIKKKYDNVEFQLLGFLDVENKSAISREQMDIWVEEGCVNYLGTTDDVRNYIAKSDCIVLPSFYREGTPRTLLESASMAKPIITTDNVGCRDVVDDGINGYICKPRNSGDLAVKIEKFIALSKDKVSDMGKNGRDKMLKEFDECIVIDKYLHNINKVLNKK
jgi:glycosyltransferase involved in cell wall biosynthesis